ncbi:MAG TPA: ATP-binding protein [Solirubrobacteraceae bacterium]|jgi:anti-sigma regulatory factor (Ser/Thr protein kinase)|nr:ATP-binding protein [Solirubrobacteraceae bacterium]
MPSRHELSRDEHAPAAARHAMRESCAGYSPDTTDTARLLVSELVTNSVQHGEGDTVTLLIDSRRPDVLRCGVIDGGSGFVPVAPADRAAGGWGLRLVERLSSVWGVREDPTHVWFDLPLGESAPQ